MGQLLSCCRTKLEKLYCRSSLLNFYDYDDYDDYDENILEETRDQSVQTDEVSCDEVSCENGLDENQLLLKHRRAILAVPWDYKQVLNNGLTLRGHSRSGERTCFYIPELSTYLDAGLQGIGEPLMILLTHGHCDHSHALPMMNIGLDVKTNLYVPRAIAHKAAKYIIAMYQLNNCTDKACNLDDKYPFTVVDSYHKYQTTIKKHQYQIETFKCYHSVPSMGFGITELRSKLKDEYLDLPGKEIGKLRKEGVEINYMKEYPLIAYMGDTTIKVFEDELNKNVFNYPYIMIESTYFYPDQIDMAIKHTHTHWTQLRPYVLQHPDIIFILIHFSPRYRDQEIIDFFDNEQKIHSINNIIVWIN